MQELESFIVYTVPSQWVNDASSPTTEPYDRVVGVGTAESTAWAATYNNGDPMGNYDRAEATKTKLHLPRPMATRLEEFFKHYFVQQPDKNDRYNCHMFAYHITGNAINNNLQWPYAPEASIQDRTPCAPDLEAGQHAVWILEKGRKCTHSVIGLGRDQASYLQVLASQGYLALMGYKSLKH